MFQASPQVQAFNLGVVPRSDGPRPVLLQSEAACYLVFEGTADTQPRSGGVAIVTFASCLISRFGYPNDEALAGHPLFKSGLRFYGVYEVGNSPWDRELRLQNRIVFPTLDMPKRRHFIVTFHDSMFECIATSAVAEISTESFLSAVSRVIKVLPNDV